MTWGWAIIIPFVFIGTISIVLSQLSNTTGKLYSFLYILANFKYTMFSRERKQKMLPLLFFVESTQKSPGRFFQNDGKLVPNHESDRFSTEMIKTV